MIRPHFGRFTNILLILNGKEIFITNRYLKKNLIIEFLVWRLYKWRYVKI